MRKLTTLLPLLAAASALAQSSPVLTGQDAFSDWTQEKPGVRRHITLADLPDQPHRPDVNDLIPVIEPRKGAIPLAPPGFQVSLYAEGFPNPRLMRTAPNGDIFLSDVTSGEIIVLRGIDANGKCAQRSTFARKLDHPFGIAFYPLGPDPQWVYVAYLNGVVRFPYKNGDLTATGNAQHVVSNLPGFNHDIEKLAGHTTKDVVFTPDGKHMLVSVGAATDDAETNDYKAERLRADVLDYTPEGTLLKVFANGIRNCVGEAINPTTGALWCSVNERNSLGENLVPDYITSVPENAFFGWPWWYMGDHLDIRHPQSHPQLIRPVNIPDILLVPHSASLEMMFYPDSFPPTASPFPADYRGNIFAAEHGSSSRNRPTGYTVIRAKLVDGHATGEYEDFLTGFITPSGKVWGRPVGVTAGLDGSLFVSDDASGSIWRVAYVGH